jgi:NTE family protein
VFKNAPKIFRTINWHGIIIFSLLSLNFSNSFAQKERPKIGLTLSGGGAKGLAHIGILKAIDSAGIKVDYITGTSMGGIIGALYSIGYSAADIERMAKKMDWSEMLTNQSSLRGVVMEEKEEYSRYAVELPWVQNGFKLPSGVVEGEELWLKFAELFFPVYNVKNFDKFNIPFKCVSADIETGEAVVSDSGEIITAIRASMAIPSLFTAIENNGKILIDGGVVRNFPVRDVKEMGADFVIGSRVSVGLQPREKVSNALQILMQIVFFKEAATSKDDIKLCDIYIPMPLENYTAASFGKADELLDYGINEGRKLYPQFKRLADSLNDIYGKQYRPESRLPVVDSIMIGSIEINGLDETTSEFFTHMMGFETGRYYTASRLGKMVRRVFGTRYYNRIIYSLDPLPNGTTRIIFNVVENPATFAKLGIHYNNFTGISLIGNLTSRNFFLPNSRSLITLNVGENFRARAEHLQYLGRGKNIALILGMEYDNLGLNTYDNFKKDGLYGIDFFKGDAKMEYSANRKFTVGAGTRYEWIQYKPSIQSVLELRGKNEFVTSYLFFSVNTLNKNIFPDRGIKVESEFGFVYNQNPKVTLYTNGNPVVNPDSLGISYNNYQRAILNVEAYLPVTSKITFLSNFQGGINFNYNQSMLNDFLIGGLTKTIRNQVLFAGLEENSVNSASVAALQIGLRYKAYSNLFVTGRMNGLADNFVGTKNILQKPDFLSGYSLSLGYNFALGPLEISAMYCDQTRHIRSYINLGIPF